MALTLTFGGVSLLSDLEIEHGGIRSTRNAAGRFVTTYNLVTKDTNANIINDFDAIDDQVQSAIRYSQNELNDTPVWLVEYADNESAKRAFVYSAELVPVSNQSTDRLLRFDGVFAMLAVTHGSWEATSTSTALNNVAFTWSDPIQAVNSVPGTIDGRIDVLRVRGSSTNTETTPLTEGWVGIREEYTGLTNFNPVWELEYATIVDTDDTSTTTVNDNNTSPVGSGSGELNAIICDFDNDATMIERASITLEQKVTGDTTNDIISNGGFETGDFTDWTQTAAGFSVSATNPKTGTYAARFYGDGSLTIDSIKQDISISAGVSYQISFSVDVSDLGATSSYVSFQASWLTSGLAVISYAAGRYYTSGLTSGYEDFTVTAVSPSNAAYLRIQLLGQSEFGDTTTADFDDIKVFPIYAEDYVGRYLVLLRAYNSAGSTTNYVQMKYGYAGSTNKSPRKEIPITATDWKLHPLGYVNFPPGRLITDTNYLRRINNLQIELWARQASGTGDLVMDALIFIPARHVFYTSDIQIARSSYTTDGTNYLYSDFYVYSLPEGDVEGIADGTDFLGVDTNIEFAPTGWSLPTGNNVVVAAFQRDASHELTDNFVINATYYPKWRNYNDA